MDRRHIEDKQYVVNPRTGRKEMRPVRSDCRPLGEAEKPRPAPKPVARDPLDGVPFASDTAEREARAGGLTRAHFASLTAEGKTGFTTAQVRELVG